MSLNRTGLIDWRGFIDSLQCPKLPAGVCGGGAVARPAGHSSAGMLRAGAASAPWGRRDTRSHGLGAGAGAAICSSCNLQELQSAAAGVRAPGSVRQGFRGPEEEEQMRAEEPALLRSTSEGLGRLQALQGFRFLP